jgi:hypothetical protein
MILSQTGSRSEPQPTRASRQADIQTENRVMESMKNKASEI